MPLRVSFLAVFALVACSSSGSPAADAGPPCTPGSSASCVGPGGCAGAQLCAPDGGGYGACDCGSGFDGGEPDAGAVPPSDGGIQAEFGLPCSQPFDCLSGDCTPVAGPGAFGDGGRSVCSKPCASAADCGPGWSCGDAGFATPYCLCRDGGCGG